MQSQQAKILDGRYGVIRITHDVATLYEHFNEYTHQIVDKYAEWLLQRDTIFLDNMDDTFSAFDGNFGDMISLKDDNRLIFQLSDKFSPTLDLKMFLR